MNNELERTSMRAVVAEEWYYPSIFSERFRKTTKSLTVSANITTEHFRNASQERYRWTNQLFLRQYQLQIGEKK
jgi:hypothetical protein